MKHTAKQTSRPSLPSRRPSILRLLPLALAGLVAATAQADVITNTYNIGPSGTGEYYEGPWSGNPGTTCLTNWFTAGTLPTYSMLRSIEIDATLESSPWGDWASDFIVLVAPDTSGFDTGTGGTLEITAYWNESWGSPLYFGWTNGSAEAVSTVNAKFVFGVNFPAPIDLSTNGVFLGDGTFEYGGYWSGTLTITYEVPGTANDIVTFALPGQPTITLPDTNIVLQVPMSTDVTSLAPTYTVSPLASNWPPSGASLDFSTPRTYSITASNGATKTYLVTVTRVLGQVNVANPSFETPAIGGWWLPVPPHASWSFSPGTGIATPDDQMFYPPGIPVPDGNQAGYMTGEGASISNSVFIGDPGDYKVHFHAIGRTHWASGFTPADLNVLIDGTNVLYLTNTLISATSWGSYTSAVFTATAGAHTLAFMNGVLAPGQDGSVIDAVAINYACPYPPTITGITGPVAGEFTIHGTTVIAGDLVTWKTTSLATTPITWQRIQTNAVPGGAFSIPVSQGTDARAFFRLMSQ